MRNADMANDGYFLERSRGHRTELAFQNWGKIAAFGEVRGNGKPWVELLVRDVAKWVNVRSVAIVRISALSSLEPPPFDDLLGP